MTLTAKPSSSAAGADALVAELIEELASRLRAGEPVDLEQVIQEHPNQADRLRQLLPTIQVLAELGRSGVSGSAPLLVSEPDPLSSTLGDFRIRREIGRGGMGIVYEAEQISLGRRVALKVLPFAATMDSQHLHRFQNEARAAASLEHPHIVPVYGVGCERGVHYYAMKFIDGQSLAELIRQQRPEPANGGCQPPDSPLAKPNQGVDTPRSPETAIVARTERAPHDAAAFRQIAEWGIQAALALEHAHSVGIVHRDIKPANLMIDGHGALWVTDFGLARTAADAGLTVTGDVLGTLRYMSPEQALAKHGLVDHRTDIYSLGVTLYELLAGAPAVGGRDREEILNAITWDEPQPLRTLEAAISPDLETIVLKTLEKNPADRYTTAQELADDLRCFLEDRIIQARRPSLVQRLAKWSRRNQPVVRSALVVSLLAAISLGITTVLTARAYKAEADSRRAAEERAAEYGALADYLVKDLLGSAAPEKTLGRKVTMEEVLSNAEKKIDISFTDQPRVEAAIRHTMGATYLKLGQYSPAQRHLLRARDLFARWYGPEAPETLRSMSELADVLGKSGQLEESRLRYEEVLQLQARALGEDHPETLKTMLGLAFLLRPLGRIAEAGQLFEKVLSGMRLVLGESHPDTLSAMHGRGLAFIDQGRWDEAQHLYEELVPRRQRVLGENHPEALQSMHTLAIVLAYRNERDEAARLLGELLTRQRLVLGEDHHDTLQTMSNLGLVLNGQGKRQQAHQLLEEVVERRRRALGEDHQETLLAMADVALVLCSQGKHEEARREYEEVLARCRKGLGEDSPRTIEIMIRLGALLRMQGQWAEAKRVQEQALEAARRVLGEPNELTARSMDELARLLAASGDLLLRDAVRAVELATKATKHAPADNELCWNTLGLARYRVGDWKGTIQALHKSMEIPRGQSLRKGGDSRDWFFLAMAHWQLGEKDQARTWYEQAIRWMDKNHPDEEEFVRFHAEAAALLGIQVPSIPKAKEEASQEKQDIPSPSLAMNRQRGPLPTFLEMAS
jgi:serine/threonine protein kinase/Tfp pilus assembly protein PilF